jgi:YihY family inner membrane protein
MNLAGLLAYNLLMAMIPIAVAIIAITGQILRLPGVQASITKAVSGVFPGIISKENALTIALHEVANETGILLVIALVVAFFLGSRLFVVLDECFAIIYGVQNRSFIPQNLMAIGMLLLFIVLIPLMVFTSIASRFIFTLINNQFLYAGAVGNAIVTIGGYVTSFIVSFILFEAIYLIVPNQHISFRYSWQGALLAAFGVEIYFLLFPFYATHFLVGISGPVGFAIILLLFFYFFAVILLLGAEINAMIQGVRPIPDYLPTFISKMVGRINSEAPGQRAASSDSPDS